MVIWAMMCAIIIEYWKLKRLEVVWWSESRSRFPPHNNSRLCSLASLSHFLIFSLVPRPLRFLRPSTVLTGGSRRDGPRRQTTPTKPFSLISLSPSWGGERKGSHCCVNIHICHQHVYTTYILINYGKRKQRQDKDKRRRAYLINQSLNCPQQKTKYTTVFERGHQGKLPTTHSAVNAHATS